MTPAELRAAGRGGLVFGGLVSRIEQVHQAIGTGVRPAGLAVLGQASMRLHGAPTATGTG